MNSLTVILLALLASTTFGGFVPMMHPGFMKRGFMRPGYMHYGLNRLMRRKSYGNFGYHGDFGYHDDFGHLGNLGNIRGLLRLLNRFNTIGNLVDRDPFSDRFDTAPRTGRSGSGQQTSVGAGQTIGQTGIVNAATNSLPQF